MPPLLHPTALLCAVRSCCFVCVCWKSGRAHSKINRLLYKGGTLPPSVHPASLCLPPSSIFFFFFKSVSLHLRDTGMGPLGLWNICTITGAGSILTLKLFSASSLFCFARRRVHTVTSFPHPPTPASPHLAHGQTAGTTRCDNGGRHQPPKVSARASVRRNGRLSARACK